MKPSKEELGKLIERMTADIEDNEAEIILYSIQNPNRAIMMSAFGPDASPLVVAAKITSAVVMAVAQEQMGAVLPNEEIKRGMEILAGGIVQDLNGWVEAILEQTDPLKDEVTNYRN